MASQKQKKSLSKSKLGIIPNVNKGVYISNKQKALVVILLAMVITLTTTAVVRMFRTQSANQSKLEQMIHAEQNLKQIDTQKQTDTQQKLQQQIDELKLQVKLKKESKIAQAAEAALQAVTPKAQASSVTGTKADWMAQAGIPESEWVNVDSIVTRESGWNPNAVNKSSGACGLGQQLPCGKWAGAWNDPVAALRAMTGYVNSRYGGWSGAVAFWNSRHWY